MAELTPDQQKLANAILARDFETAKKLQEQGVQITPVITHACEGSPYSALYKGVMDYMRSTSRNRKLN